jgi:hypothetical protein
MEPRYEVGSGGMDTAKDEEQPETMKNAALLKVTEQSERISGHPK